MSPRKLAKMSMKLRAFIDHALQSERFTNSYVPDIPEAAR